MKAKTLLSPLLLILSAFARFFQTRPAENVGSVSLPSQNTPMTVEPVEIEVKETATPVAAVELPPEIPQAREPKPLKVEIISRYQNGTAKRAKFVSRKGKLLTAAVVKHEGDTLTLSRNGGSPFNRTFAA